MPGGNDLDYKKVEDPKDYVVKFPKSAKYARILKSSAASKETDSGEGTSDEETKRW